MVKFLNTPCLCRQPRLMANKQTQCLAQLQQWDDGAKRAKQSYEKDIKRNLKKVEKWNSATCSYHAKHTPPCSPMELLHYMPCLI